MASTAQLDKTQVNEQYPQGPKSCICGHSKYVHEQCFTGKCVRCSCQQYRKAKVAQ